MNKKEKIKIIPLFFNLIGFGVVGAVLLIVLSWISFLTGAPLFPLETLAIVGFFMGFLTSVLVYSFLCFVIPGMIKK